MHSRIAQDTALLPPPTECSSPVWLGHAADDWLVYRNDVRAEHWRRVLLHCRGRAGPDAAGRRDIRLCTHGTTAARAEHLTPQCALQVAACADRCDALGYGFWSACGIQMDAAGVPGWIPSYSCGDGSTPGAH